VALNPAIGLYFTTESPTRSTARVQLRAPEIDIPAGQSDYLLEESIVLPVSSRLISIYPHAHYLGKDLQIYVDHPDGTRQPLLRIPDWDFNWQSDYRFKDPPRIPAQSRITMRYMYDNSAENPRNPFSPPRQVVVGPNSSDEMGEASFQFLLDDHSDFRAFQVAQLRYDADAAGGAAPLLYKIGIEALDAGLDDKARELFTIALNNDPKFAPAHYAFGTLAEKAGDLAVAEIAFIEAVRSDETNLGYQLKLARLLSVRGNTLGSRGVLTTLLKTHPEHLDARLLLAKSLEEEGQVDRAIRVLRIGLDSQPKSALLQLRLGFAFLAKGDPNAATTHFETGLAYADPAVHGSIIAEAEFSLALLFHNSRDSIQAELHLRRALVANPSLSEALVFGVDIALANNDLVTARDRAQRFARLPDGDRPPLAAVQAYPISSEAKELLAEAYHSIESER
jgi:tetratricopeptide (TPR) repeat protein